ncbi:hypothetical protein Aple_084320 [Acrocarpospora pleiomorpha]|uniref:Uncharacterized protein n=1 Tax=Acrocarpospora pleiomorpha TaxID=90975 RepID=A0A5M3Y1C8_9ACTN|nr:hypothetical protein [Acrocarpospora pleiomorpha]GES25533.1 hypothetical protein Aple_084320 [Acrocarpospora pleiomorpha]
MSAHAGHETPEPRVPRTADGIAAALSGSRRMEFYRQLGTAPMGQVEAVLRRWWAEAMLDSDPAVKDVERELRQGRARAGTPIEDVFPDWNDHVARARARRE